ncbi:hypothetical protein GGR50DRAFT_693428 [Xylaria sp. CBS 124048]|nr:hypothetical protein GGR50DRAFT_693428 [Xylaria sp. CBS 124048]
MNSLEPSLRASTLSSYDTSYPLFNDTGLVSDEGHIEGPSTDFHPEVGVESPTYQSGLQSIANGDIHVDAYMDFLLDIGSSSSSSDQRLVHTSKEVHLIPRPISPANEESQIDFWNLYDPTTPLYHAMKRVKGCPRDMATRNATAFLHPRLYHDYLPQCSISVFSTCVLYMNRTPENTAMGMRTLCQSARELVINGSLRIVLPPVEKLARVQALFLYQVIRLFDGDVTLRAQAEKDLALLRKWLDELCHIRENLGDPTRLDYVSVREQSSVE